MQCTEKCSYLTISKNAKRKHVLWSDLQEMYGYVFIRLSSSALWCSCTHSTLDYSFVLIYSIIILSELHICLFCSLYSA